MKLKRTRLLNNLSTKIALGMMLALPMTQLHAETEYYGGLGVMASFVQSGDFTPFGMDATFTGNSSEKYPSFDTQMGGESFIGAMFGDFGAELTFTMKTLFANKSDLAAGMNFPNDGMTIEANDQRSALFDYTNMIQNGARISGVYKMNFGGFRPYISAGVGTNVITGIPFSKPLWGFAVGGKIGTDFKLSDKMSIYAAYDLDATMGAKSETSDFINDLKFDPLKTEPEPNNNAAGVTYTKTIAPYDINQLSEDLSSKTFITDATNLTSAYTINSTTKINSGTNPATDSPSLVTIQPVPINGNYLEFPLEYPNPNDNGMIPIYTGDTTGTAGSLAVKPLLDFSTESYFADNDGAYGFAIVANSSTDAQLVTDASMDTYAYIDTTITNKNILLQQVAAGGVAPTDSTSAAPSSGTMAAPTAVEYTYEQLKTVLETEMAQSTPTKSNKRYGKSKLLNRNKSTREATNMPNYDNSKPLEFSSLLTHNIVVGIKLNF